MSDKSIVGSSNEYLPCPFCGDRDIRFIESQREHPNDRGNGWRVECGSCPCELRWFTDRAEALEYWNKRAANAHETGCAACQLGITRERGRHYAQAGDSWPCAAEPPGSYRDATGELVLPAQKAAAALPACECLVRDKEPSAYHNVKCPRFVADKL